MQAPIGPATTTELVAAVSAAGGLGTLAASWTDPAKLRAQLQRLRATLAEPFCVNLVLAFDQEERLAVVLDERTPVVSFSWDVDEALIRQAQRAGTAVYVQIGDVATAAAAAAAGADALIVQGVEAGGHVQATEPLLALLSKGRA